MKRGFTKGSGIPMSVEPTRVRFARDSTPGPKQDHKLVDRIVEVRKMLRSPMSVAEIADELGVSKPTLENFIKRRGLCDLSERRKFLSLQRSLARLGDEEAAR